MKKPFVTKDKLTEIVKEIPTPFHLYDEKGIRENAKAVQGGFCMESGVPGVFCRKGQSQPVHLIKILKEYGCGCDCSSLTELMLSEAMGFTWRRHHVFFQRNAWQEYENAR